MQKHTRRSFLRNATLGGAAVTFTPSLFAIAKDDPNRFQIGIQEYTFHRWIPRKLDHLDYPALAKEKLGITHIEYWNRPFGGKHTDKKYVGELVKRTTGEGMKNVLILVDAKTPDAALAEIEVYTLGENIALQTLGRGGTIQERSGRGFAFNMADGDANTDWGRGASGVRIRSPGTGTSAHYFGSTGSCCAPPTSCSAP